MSPELRSALRTLTASLPSGAPVTITVPADQLLALLDTEPAPSTPAAPADRLLNVKEVAERLGVGPQWVFRNQRQLGAVKVGHSVRLPSAAIDRYVARRNVNRLDPSR